MGLSNYYYSDVDESIIREELLDAKAKAWAESFIRPSFPKDKRERNPKLSSAQLRRFFNEARALEAKVRECEKIEKCEPIIKMLKSKVAYACPSNGRDRKVPIEFRRFIEELIDNIDYSNNKDFEAFMLCFEAVVGYFYGEGGR